jgi:hypothetical protein
MGFAPLLDLDEVAGAGEGGARISSRATRARCMTTWSGFSTVRSARSARPSLWSMRTASGKVVRVQAASGTTTTKAAYCLISTALFGEHFGEVVGFHWRSRSAVPTRRP